MFGKDKVKGHNRVIKGKSGFKVTRIGDFLRKKDENRRRKIALGVGATAVLGVGTALLLKKKGVKFPGQVSKKNPLAKVNDNVVVPKQSTIEMTPGNKFIKEMDEDFGIIPKKKSNVSEEILKKNEIEDSWNTPLASKNITSKETKISKPDKDQLLLSPARKPKSRGNLVRKEMLIESNKSKVTKSISNMSNTQKNYDSLPLDMKVTVQMEKLLRRPTKTSNLGRPPESTGLKVILDDSNKTPLDKVISKAKRKVGDRLKRESDIAEKKSKELKKNLKMT